MVLGLLEVEGAQAFFTDRGRYTADIQTSKQCSPAWRSKRTAGPHDRHWRTATTAPCANDWGRYGELFDYDADTGELVLSERVVHRRRQVVHRRRQGLAGHIDQSPLTHTPRTQGGVISSTNGCSPLPPRWRGMGFAAQFGPILVR